MNNSRHEGPGPRELELVRLAFDGEQPARPTAHEPSDPGTAELFDLADRLRAALGPAPLAPELESRITATLDSHRAARRASWFYRMAWTSAAACLLLAALLFFGQPYRRNAGSAPAAADVALSADDAATIASALSLLRWDSSIDYGVENLASAVAAIEQTVSSQMTPSNQTRPAAGGLPWGSGDDWDLPHPAGSFVPSGVGSSV